MSEMNGTGVGQDFTPPEIKALKKYSGSFKNTKTNALLSILNEYYPADNNSLKLFDVEGDMHCYENTLSITTYQLSYVLQSFVSNYASKILPEGTPQEKIFIKTDTYARKLKSSVIYNADLYGVFIDPEDETKIKTIKKSYLGDNKIFTPFIFIDNEDPNGSNNIFSDNILLANGAMSPEEYHKRTSIHNKIYEAILSNVSKGTLDYLFMVLTIEDRSDPNDPEMDLVRKFISSYNSSIAMYSFGETKPIEAKAINKLRVVFPE